MTLAEATERLMASCCVVQSGHFYRPTGSALVCVHCGDNVPDEVQS